MFLINFLNLLNIIFRIKIELSKIYKDKIMKIIVFLFRFIIFLLEFIRNLLLVKFFLKCFRLMDCCLKFLKWDFWIKIMK